MYDELTKVYIDKMKEELEYRITVVRPKILEEVKFTRSFGDLSENAEYHAAKRERGKNESRIRYLRNMIKTAKVINPESRPDEVGIFDTVEYYVEEAFSSPAGSGGIRGCDPRRCLPPCRNQRR